jgi:hypothetical protein
MASSAERQLEQARAARNTAHRAFRARLAQIDEDLSARGIGGRLADRAGEALAEAVDVANENRAVVAGTLAALALWLFRRPLIAWMRRLRAPEGQDGNGRN